MSGVQQQSSNTNGATAIWQQALCNCNTTTRVMQLQSSNKSDATALQQQE
jgi:hypothetical protein